MIKKIIPMLLIGIANLTYSQTQLANFFSDHMVLQQKEKVTLWGKDSANKKVYITTSWGEQSIVTTNASGKWRTKIQTPTAGGPYTIEIKGSTTVAIKDIMIGEVWLCSGQSNMEMPVKGFPNQPINGSQEAILNGNNNKIRVFTTVKNASITPLENVSGSWKVANTSTIGNFSATAYFFGNKLQQMTNVPVGLIVTSWGASRVEAWTDEASLKEFASVKFPQKVPSKNKQKTPTLLYNAMLHPFIGYTLKGAIWYQGESNRGNAHEYTALMNKMVKSWRSQWDQGNFPFYYVQIAPYQYRDDINTALLREAQLNGLAVIENAGMAVTLDIGDPKYIHPREKKTVGERLAYWALAKDYGFNGIAYASPSVKSIKFIKNKAQITFDNAPNGLSTFGKELSGFEVAGADKVFYPAKATIKRNPILIEVSAEKVSKPVAVRYAFDNTSPATLFSTAGLPASSFRSDKW